MHRFYFSLLGLPAMDGPMVHQLNSLIGWHSRRSLQLEQFLGLLSFDGH